MNTAKRRININWLLWTLQKEELILTDFREHCEELILTDFCEQKEELILTDFCEHCKKKN